MFFEMIVLYGCPPNWVVFTSSGRLILESRSGLRVIYMINYFFCLVAVGYKMVFVCILS